MSGRSLRRRPLRVVALGTLAWGALLADLACDEPARGRAGAGPDAGLTPDLDAVPRPDTVILPDAARPDARLDPLCSNATPLAMTAGQGTASGDTSTSTDQVKLTSSGCTGYSSPGPDLFYAVTLTGGKRYTVTLTPAESFDDPRGSCVKGDDVVGDGLEEVLYLAPSATALHYIGVDSYGASVSGSFSLVVAEYVPPQNDVCSGAAAMSWSGAKAAINADTAAATNKVQLKSIYCDATETRGGDLFYAVDLAAGKGYKIEVTPSSSFDPAIYIFTDCDKVSSSCLGGADAGFSGAAERLGFIASTTGTHIIGVDSYSSSNFGAGGGALTLKVTEVAGVVCHSSCSAPRTLSWSGGTATITDDTTAAINQYSLLSCGNKSGPWPGPQLYYKVPLTAGKTYRARLT